MTQNDLYRPNINKSEKLRDSKSHYKLKFLHAMFNAVIHGTNVIMIPVPPTQIIICSLQGPLGNMKPVKKNAAPSQLKPN